MTKKGNLILIIIIALLAITILPALVMIAFPLADIIMRLILVFELPFAFWASPKLIHILILPKNRLIGDFCLNFWSKMLSRLKY